MGTRVGCRGLGDACAILGGKLTNPGLASIPKGVLTIPGRHRIAAELGGALREPAVAIGNFDGVHRGHRALLDEARRRACAAGGQTVALTFSPHPARFFAPDLAPPLLTPLDRRVELLGLAGADVVIVEPFTAELAATSPEDFVRQVLQQDLGARHVVVGADFSFGHERRGTPALLASLGTGLGMGIHIVPPVTAHGLVCSSTKIREFVLEGRVEGASMLLGRPFEVDGTVVKGAGRGRTLGIPTVNLAHDGEILPSPGVYAGRACRLDDTAGRREHECFAAAISIGTNPTFADRGEPKLTVEAHLLDFAGDLYGARLRLAFLAHLREQRRYENASELKAAIALDIARTREICT
jgi:riboflavin kinase/FMN adenylyltransferase